MGKRRSKEEVAAIDSFIRENYPNQGPAAVAESLGEPEKYIKQRAQNIGVSLDPTKGGRGGKRIKAHSLSRAALESKIKILVNQFTRQKALNSELRLENIKLIAENRRLRGIYENSKS